MDTCFTVQFDRADLPSKNIWADSFRVIGDDLWVEFLDRDGDVVSTVRTFNMVAIDRQCKAPAESSAFRPEVPSSSPPPAGPVEAAMRNQGAPVPPQSQMPQQQQPQMQPQSQQPQRLQPQVEQGPAMAGRR